MHVGLAEMLHSLPWVHQEFGLDWNNLTISCLPAYYAVRVPGRNWVWTMTEGSELPDGWAHKLLVTRADRLIVPCEYNAIAFNNGMIEKGFEIPIHILPGGTDPAVFQRQELNGRYDSEHKYTFLSLGDRGPRKGWTEVWQAFFKAFGTPDETPDVRLIIKSRPQVNAMLDMISQGDGLDPRITIQQEDLDEMSDAYEAADCIAMPSRSEGWGLPHRDAAMMGKPVITQQYGGLDDGHTAEWSMPISGGKLDRIPSEAPHIKGEWMKAPINVLADKMRWCYDNPNEAAEFGQNASRWLEEHQTWDHAALALIDLIEEYS